MSVSGILPDGVQICNAGGNTTVTLPDGTRIFSAISAAVTVLALESAFWIS